MHQRRIVLACLLFTALFFTTFPLLAQGVSDNVRGLNGRVLQFLGALQQGNAAEKARIRAEAAPVFSQRAAALTALIRQDPGSALSLAFSQDLLTELRANFPGSASNLEQQGAWSGTSDHIIFDDPERQVRRFQVQIQSGNDAAEVYSAAGEPHCVSGETLTAEGIRIGNVIAAGTTKVQQNVTAAAATCTTTGTQNAVVILVQFPTISLPTGVTPTVVNDIFFSSSGRSVRTYWEEASYGKASASGTVAGPYTLDRIYTCDEYNQMRAAAIAAADPDVDFRNYTRVFIVFPNPGSCGWAGLGTLGCSSSSSADGSFTASTSWLLASYMGSRDNGVKLSTHEGGHNLTLHHASSRDFGTEPLGPLGAAGTLSEYGDPFNTMGSWNFGHYGAPHKVRLGWLTGSNVQTIETGASQTILPFETATGGLQAMKIRRGTGNNAWLWLEYRRPLGQYDSTLSSQVYTGALVHYEDSTTGTHTHLLDFTPGTDSFSDPALTSTWSDPYTNVSLSVTNATATGLNVDVYYGPVPCVRYAPTVTISPQNPTVSAGANVNYNVTVLNNDSTGCGAATFSMASILPPGWSAASFSPDSLSLSPTVSGSTTMTVSVPADAPASTYPVKATAWDADHSATGNANVTVVQPIFITSVTATPNSVAVRDNVTIRATVTTATNSPVTGATVTFRLNRPGGTATATATTNSSGIAEWVYKAQQKGSYSVNATASAGGATATSSPTATFTAN
jgi:M6 family metalloprotease-like protein